MKLFLPFAALLLLATAALAAEDKPAFEIHARYEGFDPALFTEANPPLPSASPERAAGAASGIQSAPLIVVPAGQRATIEIVQEHLVPTADDPKHVNTGITLSVTPEFQDGKVTLFGESVVRHQLPSGDDQPLHAQSFTTRETFFNGAVAEGQDYVIRVGENPKDAARITLNVKRAKIYNGETHAGPPRFHVFALQPSSDEAKKPIYRSLGFGPNPEPSTAFIDKTLRKDGLAVWGVFDASQVAQMSKDDPTLPSEKALRPVPDADVPFKVTGTVGPDGYTVDMQLEPTGKPAGPPSTSVSIYWGGEVWLAVTDATQSDGKRLLIVKQD